VEEGGKPIQERAKKKEIGTTPGNNLRDRHDPSPQRTTIREEGGRESLRGRVRKKKMEGGRRRGREDRRKKGRGGLGGCGICPDWDFSIASAIQSLSHRWGGGWREIPWK